MKAWRPSRRARRSSRRIRPDITAGFRTQHHSPHDAVFAERPTPGTATVSAPSPHAGPRKAITMKDAKTLLLEFLAAVTHGENAAALFAADGAVELPFLHSLGIPWRHHGRQAIRELQDSLARL